MLIARLLRLRLGAAAFMIACLCAAGASLSGESQKYEIVPMVRHSSYVGTATVSYDGKYALSASNDGGLKLWELSSGRLVRTIDAHTGIIRDVHFLPHAMLALSAGDDSTIKLWDLAAGTLIRTFKGHTDRVTALSVSPDGKMVLSASQDKSVKLWDLGAGTLLHTFDGHTGPVAAVSFCARGSQAISGSWDDSIKLWDISRKTLLRTAKVSSAEFFAFSSDCKKAVTTSGYKNGKGKKDGILSLWNTTSGELIGTKNAFQSFADVHSLTFSSDDNEIILGSGYDNNFAYPANHTIKTWNAANGQLRTLAQLHEAGAAVFSRDGGQLLSTGREDALTLWDIASGRAVRKFGGLSLDVLAISVSKYGKHIMSGDSEGAFSWEAMSGRIQRSTKWGSNKDVLAGPVALVEFLPTALAFFWAGWRMRDTPAKSCSNCGRSPRQACEHI